MIKNLVVLFIGLLYISCDLEFGKIFNLKNNQNLNNTQEIIDDYEYPFKVDLVNRSSKFSDNTAIIGVTLNGTYKNITVATVADRLFKLELFDDKINILLRPEDYEYFTTNPNVANIIYKVNLESATGNYENPQRNLTIGERTAVNTATGEPFYITLNYKKHVSDLRIKSLTVKPSVQTIINYPSLSLNLNHINVKVLARSDPASSVSTSAFFDNPGILFKQIQYTYKFSRIYPTVSNSYSFQYTDGATLTTINPMGNTCNSAIIPAGSGININHVPFCSPTGGPNISNIGAHSVTHEEIGIQDSFALKNIKRTINTSEIFTPSYDIINKIIYIPYEILPVIALEFNQEILEIVNNNPKPGITTYSVSYPDSNNKKKAILTSTYNVADVDLTDNTVDWSAIVKLRNVYNDIITQITLKMVKSSSFLNTSNTNDISSLTSAYLNLDNIGFVYPDKYEVSSSVTGNVYKFYYRNTSPFPDSLPTVSAWGVLTKTSDFLSFYNNSVVNGSSCFRCSVNSNYTAKTSRNLTRLAGYSISNPTLASATSYSGTVGTWMPKGVWDNQATNTYNTNTLFIEGRTKVAFSSLTFNHSSSGVVASGDKFLNTTFYNLSLNSQTNDFRINRRLLFKIVDSGSNYYSYGGNNASLVDYSVSMEAKNSPITNSLEIYYIK